MSAPRLPWFDRVVDTAVGAAFWVLDWADQRWPCRFSNDTDDEGDEP